VRRLLFTSPSLRFALPLTIHSLVPTRPPPMTTQGDFARSSDQASSGLRRHRPFGKWYEALLALAQPPRPACVGPGRQVVSAVDIGPGARFLRSRGDQGPFPFALVPGGSTKPSARLFSFLSSNCTYLATLYGRTRPATLKDMDRWTLFPGRSSPDRGSAERAVPTCDAERFILNLLLVKMVQTRRMSPRPDSNSSPLPVRPRSHSAVCRA
jgi:hypothetical protein